MRSLSTPPPVVPWDLPPPDSHATSDEYRAALSELYAFSDRARSAAEIRLARERKLDRMRVLLGLLGSPQVRFQTVLVAGTKGKGSMAAMLSSILHAAGVRVGRYTQPHLYSYRERTWACGEFVDERQLVAELKLMSEAIGAVDRRRSELGPLTTFDVGTALSLLHFARSAVEVAVVEVGVGGANDATNVLEPILGLIGPIGLDHMDALGSDLVTIAREKAGILRQGIDAVVAPQEAPAREAIDAAADAIGARVCSLEDCAVRPGDMDCTFSVSGAVGEIRNLTMPLSGQFQRANAAMAVSAAQLLDRRGWSITERDIRAGLAEAHWPGRFQTVVRDPLTIVDGAHNPCAARALAQAIRTSLPQRPLTLILGMSKDKDVASTMSELAPLAERVIFTAARHERSWTPEQLADTVRSVAPDLEQVIVRAPGDALELAWASQPAHGVTIVTGSLFLVGDVLEWLLP